MRATSAAVTLMSRVTPITYGGIVSPRESLPMEAFSAATVAGSGRGVALARTRASSCCTPHLVHPMPSLLPPTLQVSRPGWA